MVKIVEAPKNVPASEKAAALYTGIQRKNEARRKELEKEEESKLWKDLIGGAVQLGYETMMDRRLAEKSANFFANEEYLSNQALASKAMTNATTHQARNEAALKYKDGERAYWKNAWINDIYLPQLNKFAGERATPTDMEALRAIAEQHVEQDFSILWDNKTKIDTLSSKVIAAGGGKELTNLTAAWDAARKIPKKIEARRLTELGILGSNEPVNPATLLKNNAALQNLTKTFTEFNAEYVKHINQGVSVQTANALRKQAMALPALKQEVELKNIKINGKDHTMVWAKNTNRAFELLVQDPNGNVTRLTELEVNNINDDTITSHSAAEKEAMRNKVNNFKPAMRENDLKEFQKTKDKVGEQLKEEGVDKQGQANRERMLDEAWNARVFKLAEKYRKNYRFTEPASYRLAAAMDSLQDDIKTNLQYKFNGKELREKDISYAHFMKTNYPLGENPFLIYRAAQQVGLNIKGSIEMNLADAMDKRMSNKKITQTEKAADLVFIQQFVEGIQSDPQQAIFTREQYNNWLNVVTDKEIQGTNTLKDKHTYELKDEVPSPSLDKNENEDKDETEEPLTPLEKSVMEAEENLRQTAADEGAAVSVTIFKQNKGALTTIKRLGKEIEELNKKLETSSPSLLAENKPYTFSQTTKGEAIKKDILKKQQEIKKITNRLNSFVNKYGSN